MKARSVVLGALLAAALSAGAAGSAEANLVWCMTDPPVQVNTASGTNLTVNTTVYLDKASVNLKNDVSETATTAPDGNGGTLITVRVDVPAGVSSARAVATLKSYKISTSGTGVGGSVITLYLDAPTS